MIKKLKRLSTKIRKIGNAIDTFYEKILLVIKYLKRIGIGLAIYFVVFIGVLIADNATTKSSRILNVLTNQDLENLEIGQDTLSNNSGNKTKIIDEKIAEDSHVIFSKVDSIMYNMEDTLIKTGPELEKYDTYEKIKAGSSLNVLGINVHNVAKILYDNQELFIDANLLTNNKDYIFESVDGVSYAKLNTKAYVNLETDEGINILSGQEISYTGLNDSQYTRIQVDGTTYYIYSKDISNSSSYIYEQENKTMYAKGSVKLFATQDDDAQVLYTFESGSSVKIIGTNNSEYYKVKVNDLEGYVFKSKLTNSRSDLYPFLTLSSKSALSYNEENCKDGIVAIVPEDQKTEENVYLLAQLIHCEAGGQGYDGQRAVATVVVNRVYDGTMGNTIYSVIHRPSQFSPVGSGKINRVIPTEANIQAARDVLIDGYRSFPAYVLYFQSISDGYFKGQLTYCTAYNNNWTHPQYFSYKQSDYEKYKK